METIREVPWITPYPDRLLDEIAPSEDEPEAVIVTRETIELAFLAALQVLPPRQRATLIARDVLGWPAVETAAALDTSVAAVNSALQRARATLQAHLPAQRTDWSPGEPSDEERRAARELHRGPRARRRRPGRLDRLAGPADHDAAGAVAVRGHRRSSGRCSTNALSEGDWRLLPTVANRMPTAASYLRAPGDTIHRAFKFDVLRIVDGRIAEITTFGTRSFPQFGLPATIYVSPAAEAPPSRNGRIRAASASAHAGREDVGTTRERVGRRPGW